MYRKVEEKGKKMKSKEKAKNEVEGKGKKMIDVQSIADYNNLMFSNIQISKNQNSSGNSPVYFSV